MSSAAASPLHLHIESLDQEGRGVAHADGKVVFVEGALPGEEVIAVAVRDKGSFAIARVERIVRASAGRVVPRCPHFGVCGGCTLQHAHPSLQIAAKQRALEDALSRIGKVHPEQMLPPIAGPAWGYRYRARLSVRYVAKKGGVLVGFHERKSSFVADMMQCEVMPRRISDLLPVLRTVIGALSIRDKLPQIEVIVAERAGETVHALLLRILAPFTPEDEAHMTAFADTHGVELWTQTGGPATVLPWYPRESVFAYTLPEFGIEMPFGPGDFTQVNASINRVLVRRAIMLLGPEPGERIADLFCGLGNFTLPIARRGAFAVGVEGAASLVKRAADNAARNGLAERTQFIVANLFAATPETIAALGPLNRALIDPPRDGALELVKSLPMRADPGGLSRIVYVSCAPGTLARDAAVLVNERGYRLRAAGVVNMVPHTAHVESIAVFE
ncbi:MAG: 23S rRNA (uracil(1939)-C(5))-methyltransferase RlmD [Betaproteobacteria bacterium]